MDGHDEAVSLGFGGEVAELYQQYRRDYPASVVDAVMHAFSLTDHDTVIDLGCGTGQLTVPFASRVRAVVGVDPEPDMLVRARRTAVEQGTANVAWMLGSDTDMPALGSFFGRGSVGAVTIGQALHWMDEEALFPALMPLFRTGGGIAVVTNGTPLWLQDNDWSRGLRGCLERWFGVELSGRCGTDEASQRRYREGLTAAGYEVGEARVDYTDDMTFEQLVGGVYSAFSVEDLPAPEERPRFADQVRRAIHPQTRFSEHVRVAVLLGRVG